MGFWRKLREILDVTPLSRKMMDVGTFAGERLVQEIEDNAELIRKERDNMTKQQPKIHLIKDEALGGIKREYVEVERKAEVGELAIILRNTCNGNDEGFIGKVTDVDPFGTCFEGGKANWHSDYNALEPIDIVHIDGSRFRLVDRKAEVGECVLIIDEDDSKHIGLAGVVADIYHDEDISVDVGETLDLFPFAFRQDYRVLVPVEETLQAETSPQSTDDIIANLARRVAELKRRDESQRRLNGVTSQRIAELSQRIDGAHRDIETWAQEVEKVRNELGEKVEMCIGDIVTLDERTQSIADSSILIGGTSE